MACEVSQPRGHCVLHRISVALFAREISSVISCHLDLREDYILMIIFLIYENRPGGLLDWLLPNLSMLRVHWFQIPIVNVDQYIVEVLQALQG